ncbi:unnamed protein product [Meganyctiphanes norvegica]|uniref:Uncharacterized protein n=1 Tax=Meganyctiphanes norvegica TaxID=48144 RepID=A0AAV2QIY4_MEGNR
MMCVTKVLTSVFVVCLSGPTFGYPFTHSNLFSAAGAGDNVDPRGSQQAQQQQQQLPAHLEDYLANRGQLPAHLEDYVGNYVQQGRGQYPQYQLPAYQQDYNTQVQPQPKLTAETLAALLPYLSSSSQLVNGIGSAPASSDYAYPDYPVAAPAYTDTDGTWYDDMAASSQQVYNNEPSAQDEEQAVLQLLLDHLNGRYSLDDLEAMEREAEMEENTESQLQSLMNKKMVKKSSGGVFPGAAALGGHSGQKEEAPLMPATSVRRPVWGQQQQQQGNRQGASGEGNAKNTEVKRSSDGQGTITGDAVEGLANNKVVSDSSSSSSSSSTPASAISSSSTAIPSIVDDSSSNNADSSNLADSVAQDETTMTPRLQTAYDALKKYLDRERKFRQEQDDLSEISELTEPSPRTIQKRFAPDEDTLSQQLVNLKKNHS